MEPPVNTIASDFAYIAWWSLDGVDGLHVMPSACELKSINSDSSLSRRDLTGHLFTLRWPLVVIWVCKLVDRGRVGERPLCRSQIKSKNARVSQTIDRKGRWPDGKAGASMQEGAYSASSTVLAGTLFHPTNRNSPALGCLPTPSLLSNN